MRMYLKSLILISLAVVSSYIGIADNYDPAQIISQYDIPKDFVISEIKGKSSKNIVLKAGNEKFGFNHILKRHSDIYFTNDLKKGKLFPKGTSGYQIIKGMKDVYTNGEIEKSVKGNKKIYNHELDMNGEKGNYRLVLNQNHEIITFYKLNRL